MADQSPPKTQSRISTRKIPAASNPRFEEGPQFALILGEELAQIQISTIIKHLSSNGMIVLQSQTLNRSKNLIFVELANPILIFKEAQELQILKNIPPQSQQEAPIQAISPKFHRDPIYPQEGESPMQQLPQSQRQNYHQNSRLTFGNLIESPSTATANTNKRIHFSQEQQQQQQQQQQHLNNIKQSIELSTSIGVLKAFSADLPPPSKPIVVPKEQQEQRLNSIDPRILLLERLSIVSISTILRDAEERDVKSALKKRLGIFTPAERMRITYSYMNKIAIKDIKLIEFLQEQQSIEEIVPLHMKAATLTNNTQSIEDYYGENISIYFEFLDFYQKALVYPAIASIPVYLISANSTNATTILFVKFVYSLLICLWMTLFYISWRRYESELQVRWGVYGKKIYKEDRNVNFKGIKRIKSTTMIQEEYYPTSKRIYLYLLSAIESIPLLLIAIFLKLVIFNLNGLISSEESILYLPIVAGLVKEGGMLYNLPLKDHLLNVTLIVLIIKVNDIYTHLSLKSTARENHRTNNEFNSSLVIKRFIFDLINRFTHFFFIGFVIRDVNSLKNLLSSLFLMDEVRKVATESVIPWAVKFFLARKQQKKAEETNGDTDETFKRNEEMNSLYTENIREIDTWPYDNFDDYIEVVAQIAFVTLFAAVSPLAALLSYLFNFFESHSDRFKLQNRLYRRPLPFKVTGIGAWNKVVLLISIFCVYTNVAFLAFDYFDIYKLNAASEINLNSNSSSSSIFKNPFHRKEEITWLNVYLSIFQLEHFILILLIFIHLLYQQNPKWVRVYRRRMLTQSSTTLAATHLPSQ